MIFAFEKRSRRLVTVPYPHDLSLLCERDDIEAGQWLFFDEWGAQLDVSFPTFGSTGVPRDKIDVPILKEAPRNALFTLRTYLDDIERIEGFVFRQIEDVRYHLDAMDWLAGGCQGEPIPSPGLESESAPRK